MITLTQPSMAINDYRVFPSRYQMWNTWNVDWEDNREHIVNWVATVARSTKRKKLDNIVINCHGNSGALHLGKSWFSRKHTYLFRRWKNLVERIWITACEVALIEEAGTKDDGNMFISKIARAANCHVVASTETQRNLPVTYPYGKLDTFEGLVLEYGPTGKVVWSHRYGDWLSNLE